ncbi:MAG: hypothetical protein ABI870_12180 [Rhodanobacter sp.]
MDHAMLDVRPIANRFVIFDTEFNEPVMRFDNRPDADAFLAEMTIAECHALLESWVAPEKPAQAA